MTLYKAVYKCRLCGKTFYEEVTGSRNTAFHSVLGVAMNGKFYPEGCCIGSHLFDCHSCDDGSCGLADFQGFRKEEEND